MSPKNHNHNQNPTVILTRATEPNSRKKGNDSRKRTMAASQRGQISSGGTSSNRLTDRNRRNLAPIEEGMGFRGDARNPSCGDGGKEKTKVGPDSSSMALRHIYIQCRYLIEILYATVHIFALFAYRRSSSYRTPYIFFSADLRDQREFTHTSTPENFPIR